MVGVEFVRTRGLAGVSDFGQGCQMKRGYTLLESSDVSGGARWIGMDEWMNE